MGLLQRLKHDLKTGLVTLRLGTAQAANRALEETELLRVRLEIRKLDQQLDEHYRDVGERAVSLREAGEPAERILYDTEITRLVKEIQQLKEDSGEVLSWTWPRFESTNDVGPNAAVASCRCRYRDSHLPTSHRRYTNQWAADRIAIGATHSSARRRCRSDRAAERGGDGSSDSVFTGVAGAD